MWNRIRQRHTVVGLIPTLVGSVTLIVLSPRIVQAQLPTTLEGEIFEQSDPRSASGSASGKETGDGGITLSLKGKAAGPVVGTFSENATIKFDPASGAVLDATVTFELYDAHGVRVAIGTKSALEGSVSCAFDKFTNLKSFGIKALLSYKADVSGTPDAGEATLDVVGNVDSSGTLKALQFLEMFHSSAFGETFGKVTGGGHINSNAGVGITFGFNAQSNENAMKGSGVVIDRTVGVVIKIRDVGAFGQLGTKAAFTGTAEVNGKLESYRIDIDDLGQPGAGADTFKIVTTTYATGGVLTGGNIQLH